LPTRKNGVKSKRLSNAVKKPRRNVYDILADEKAITRALRESVRHAMVFHKQIGNPVCVWRNGRVVWVKAEEVIKKIDQEMRQLE